MCAWICEHMKEYYYFHCCEYLQWHKCHALAPRKWECKRMNQPQTDWIWLCREIEEGSVFTAFYYSSCKRKKKGVGWACPMIHSNFFVSSVDSLYLILLYVTKCVHSIININQLVKLHAIWIFAYLFLLEIFTTWWCMILLRNSRFVLHILNK